MTETNHQRKKLVDTQSNTCDLFPNPSISSALAIMYLLSTYSVLEPVNGITSKVNLYEFVKAAPGKSQDRVASTAKICFLSSKGNYNNKLLRIWLHLRPLLALQVLCLPYASNALLPHVQKVHTYLHLSLLFF